MDIWVAAIGGGAKLAHWPEMGGSGEQESSTVRWRVFFLVDLQVIDL